MLNQKKWMIYGANGYTGRLIARRAVSLGMYPLLAGRDRASLERLANELDCQMRIFSLESASKMAEQLADVDLVLNCAGPFVQTAEHLIEACLQSGTHYLDITGEWNVIEHAASQGEQAKRAGIVVIPAVGFDVVPSDCLAKQLANALPDATRLELAFRIHTSGAALSPGTANTMLSQLGQGTFARIDGQIQRLDDPWQAVKIPFASGERSAVAISWGDIASAFHSTGIPNIRVYQPVSKSQIRKLQRWNWLLPVVAWSPIQWLGRKWIKRNIPGPAEQQRQQSHSEFWGRVTNDACRSVEGTLSTPEGYTLTSHTAVETARRVLAGEVSPGFHTPAMALGGQYIEQFDGVKIDVQRESSELK